MAAQTRPSHVDGQKGELIIAGYPIEELAPNATFEEVVYLLWTTGCRTRTGTGLLAGGTGGLALAAGGDRLPRKAATEARAPMDVLRMAAGTLDLELPEEMRKQ